MQLLRTVIGDVLREARTRQERTLRDVAAAAGVSLGYLSEVERGRKEASSELLAAICSALGVSLAEVFHEVSEELARRDQRVLAGAGRRPIGFVTPPAAARRDVAGLPPLHFSPGQRPLAPTGRPSVPVGALRAELVDRWPTYFAA